MIQRTNNWAWIHTVDHQTVKFQFSVLNIQYLIEKFSELNSYIVL